MAARFETFVHVQRLRRCQENLAGFFAAASGSVSRSEHCIEAGQGTSTLLALSATRQQAQLHCEGRLHFLGIEYMTRQHWLRCGTSFVGLLAIIATAGAADRVVRISTDRLLGSCVIVDPNKPLLSERDQEGALQKQREDGQPIPEPQKLDGEVRIPEGKALSLWLTRGLDSVPLGDISSLDVLRPEDVNEVHVAGRLDLQAARQLSWFTKIRRFYLYSADKDYDTPEGYAELGKLQSLESLTVEVFQDNYFGDDALFKELAGLKRLRWISIPTLRVTDAGMEALLRHPALETICLASHPKLLPLSDRSIRVVQSWPNLRGCVLACGGRLTDPVLRDFGQKKKLESLHLTLKSPAAAEFFLKETLPMCEVQFGVMFLPGEPIEPIGGGTFGIAPVAPAQNRATRPDVVPTPNFPTRPRGKVR